MTVAGDTRLKDDKQSLAVQNTQPEPCTDSTGKCSIKSQWTEAAFHLDRGAVRSEWERKVVEEKGLGSSVTVRKKGDRIQGESRLSFPPAMQNCFHVHERALCSCVGGTGPEMLVTAQAGRADMG